MKQIIILFAISLLLMSSCKKENLPYSFEGIITDIDGKVIPNAKVQLITYYGASNAISSGGSYELAKATTDKNGKFVSKFNYSEAARNFEVRVFADDYYVFFNSKVYKSDIQNSTLTQNPVISKLATIKIVFKNIINAQPTDEFRVNQSWELIFPPFDTFIERKLVGGVFSEQTGIYSGSIVEGYVTTKAKGDNYTVVYWTTKKNGVSKFTKDSIYISGRNQGVYNITY